MELIRRRVKEDTSCSTKETRIKLVGGGQLDDSSRRIYRTLSVDDRMFASRTECLRMIWCNFDCLAQAATHR